MLIGTKRIISIVHRSSSVDAPAVDAPAVVAPAVDAPAGASTEPYTKPYTVSDVWWHNHRARLP